MLPDSAQPRLVAMFKSAGHDVADDETFQFDFNVDYYEGCSTCGHGSYSDTEIVVYVGYMYGNQSMTFADMSEFINALFASTTNPT